MLQVFAKTFALTLARASSLCQTTRNIAPMPRSKTVASSRLRENGSALSVSQKFLAEHLGLSPATVSLVINRSPAAKSIPHRTQERIRQAARELNYRPNFVARSLRAQRSFTIGVVVPEISEGYAALVMSGIEDYLLQEGYFYFVVSHRHRNDLVDEYPRLLQQRAVEGLIAVDTACQGGVPIPVVAVSGHRELQMYQAILSRLQRLGTPRLYAVRWEPERGIYWLFLEDTGTSRLRECRNFARWIPAAQWAARFHAACRSLAHSLTSFLPVYNEKHYRRCAERVEQMLPGLELEDRRLIGQALEHYMGRIEWLSALPRTVIHGQYFGRNIMLRRRNREQMIAVIDWETAALGPGLIDLVSFTSGKWTDEQRQTMWRAYFDQYEAETEVSRDWEDFCKELMELELYQALEWLAWWRNRSVSHNFGKWVTELKRITSETAG